MMLSEFLLNTYRLENMFLISKCFCTLSQKMFSSVAMITEKKYYCLRLILIIAELH